MAGITAIVHIIGNEDSKGVRECQKQCDSPTLVIAIVLYIFLLPRLRVESYGASQYLRYSSEGAIAQLFSLVCRLVRSGESRNVAAILRRFYFSLSLLRKRQVKLH